MAAELHPTRNPGIDPALVLAGSGRRLWWRCSTCQNEWQARVSNRARGMRTPV
ncbi:MAG: zinc-ribbon domain-containing protein [Solirubrobacteraceae bacterium]